MVTIGKFEIRRFTPEYLPAVMEINRTCLPENYTSYFFMEIYQNCPEAFLLATVGNRVIGYMMCRLEHGFSELSRLKMLKKAHLVSLAVVPEFRRMGVACSLLTEALDAVTKRGAREFYLEVRITNEPGIELYKRLGFSICRRISYYYHDGADAYVMCKKLFD
jgi:ribosomal-protein-alanine N-acetyltransferase